MPPKLARFRACEWDPSVDDDDHTSEAWTAARRAFGVALRAWCVEHEVSFADELARQVAERRARMYGRSR
jgi:hypothetical protein